MEPPPATREAAPNAESPHSDMAKVINQIRKWGCYFDGKDPLSFLERVEELQQGYGFSGEQLLMGLPELLRGETLFWYRNNPASWTTWEEFSREFRQQCHDDTEHKWYEKSKAVCNVKMSHSINTLRPCLRTCAELEDSPRKIK